MTEEAPARAGQLDAEELMFLALKAIDRDDDEEAIRLLKRALGLEPRSGVLHHLLGAVYAQLGMAERAIAEMTLAIECNPQLLMARFQLGMLHFMGSDAEAAGTVWAPLAELPAEHPLRLFRDGLLRITTGELPEAIADLRAGLERNADYTSLSADMEAMIALCEDALAAPAGPDAAPAPAPAADAGARHVLLSGYQGIQETRK